MIATIAGFLGVRELFVKLGIGLLTLLAIGFAVWRIIAWYDAQLDAARKQGEESAYAKVEKRVLDISAKLTASAEKLKSEANEANRFVVADANDLRVRGPGKASCPALEGATTGGYFGNAPEAGPAVAPVPYRAWSELICLPFAGTVSVFEQHDKLLIEADTWRKDHAAQSKIIDQERK